MRATSSPWSCARGASQSSRNHHNGMCPRSRMRYRALRHVLRPCSSLPKQTDSRLARLQGAALFTKVPEQFHDPAISVQLSDRAARYSSLHEGGPGYDLSAAQFGTNRGANELNALETFSWEFLSLTSKIVMRELRRLRASIPVVPLFKDHPRASQALYPMVLAKSSWYPAARSMSSYRIHTWSMFPQTAWNPTV